MPTPNPTIAVSAPGKVLLAGGYLVLDREFTGTVFGLSARINIVAQGIHTSEGVHLTEIVVESPQFLEAQWRYGYHLAEEGGGIKVTQLQVGSRINKNPFVETTLNFALTYIARAGKFRPTHSVKSARLTILADNDYYSHDGSSGSGSGNASTPSSSSSSATPPATPSRFAHFPTTLGNAHKTGLGSSAALVTSLSAALLTHYLPTSVFDLGSAAGKRVLHNLAQAAHCAAQGKVGSGFDVAAAVYGSCHYRRFSPAILSTLPEAGAPGFAAQLERVVEGTAPGAEWDTEVVKEAVRLPAGVAMRMCDVDCGSESVGMAKGVLAWRAKEPEKAREIWNALQARNERLEEVLREGRTDEIREAIHAVRELVREMGVRSGVPIEPESQTELLDALETVEGVYGGVVPGAGGYDAAAILVKDDDATVKRIEEFLVKWSKEKSSKVKLMGVKGELEGARHEKLEVYQGWV